MSFPLCTFPQSRAALNQQHAPQVALLLVVAGYQHYEKFGDLNADGLRIHFEINAIGPILMAQALRHNLESGSKVGSHLSHLLC
jgi:short-subunit dehydrogenase